MTAILGYVVLFVLVLVWIHAEYRDIYRKERLHAVSPKPRVVETPADAAPPPYVSAVGCTGDSLEGLGDSVEARELHGTTELRLVKRGVIR